MTEIAIVYDFDGTLAEGNLPEHGLLRDLGVQTSEFWKEAKEYTREHDCDEILCYMQLLREKAVAAGLELTRDKLRSYGCRIPLFKGVLNWFGRINDFGNESNVHIKHFVVSSGIGEIIESTPIAGQFEFIFASKYLYNFDGQAKGVGVAINYTTKTQFLFRINKGIFNYFDNEKINKWVPMKKRPYPFDHIIYLGDGDTDIPSMKMTRSLGGHAIAVFDPKRWESGTQQEGIYKLIAEDRAQYVAPADYSEGSQLDVVIKGIIGRIMNELG